MQIGPTSDHDEILRWAKRHDAVPAEIRPYTTDRRPSILHFLFGSAKVGLFELRPISWEEFFTRFDRLGLAMVCSDQPSFKILPDRSRSARMLQQVT